MKASLLFRWSGMLGIFVAVLNLIVEFLPDRLGGPLNLFANTLGLWVLAGLYLRQREESGIFGLIGYLTNSFGMAVLTGLLFAQTFVLTDLDAGLVQELMAGTTGQAALVSFGIFILGVILFGSATFRAGVFPKWAAGLYILGFLLVAAGLSGPAVITTIGEGVVSAALIGLSYPLLSIREE